MTREEAINVLDAVYFLDADKQEALGMAIRSLEAWDEVLKKIEQLSHEWEYDLGYFRCLSIINRHLKEVNNGKEKQ